MNPIFIMFNGYKSDSKKPVTFWVGNSFVVFVWVALWPSFISGHCEFPFASSQTTNNNNQNRCYVHILFVFLAER